MTRDRITCPDCEHTRPAGQVVCQVCLRASLPPVPTPPKPAPHTTRQILEVDGLRIECSCGWYWYANPKLNEPAVERIGERHLVTHLGGR